MSRRATGIGEKKAIIRKSKDVRLQSKWACVFRLKNPDGVSLMDVIDGCRWPLLCRGDDRMPRCCGEKIVTGTSYCERHFKKSIQNKREKNE